MDLLTWMTTLLRQPAIMVGIIAFIGLVAQKERLSKIVLGTLKTTLGFLILNIGIGAIVSNISGWSGMFFETFNLQGVFPSDEAATGALLATLGTEIGAMMGLSMLISLIAARILPWKNVYLSGHKHWGMCGIVSLTLSTLGLDSMTIILLGSVVVGIYMTTMPELIQPFVREVTGGKDDWSIGHVITGEFWISTLVAKLLGNKKNKVDDIKVPEDLEFFKDMALSSSICFILLYIGTSLIAGPTIAMKYTGGMEPILWSFITALGLVAGLLALIYGVKMLLAEIVPAFNGISKRLIPGAKPGLDIPVLMPYSPVGVLVGFISMMIGWILIGMPLSGALTGIVSAPSMTAIFIGGGCVGVLGNAVGGARGTVIAGLVMGITWPILSSTYATILPVTAGIAYLSPDNILVSAILLGLGKLLGLA